MHRNKAFTIAELLITLTIIGVIAALTITSIITNTEKLITETKLKKIYAELTHALDIGVTKNGNLNESDFSYGTEVNIFDIYFRPYLKMDRMCTDAKGEDCGYKKGKFWRRRDLDYEQSFPQTGDSGSDKHRTMAKLQNGTVIVFNPYSADSGGVSNRHEIIVDIDGPKGKNVYGRDVFIFTINFDTGKIVPKRYYDSIKVVSDKCKSTGHWCAAWIAKSGWKIPKDYPW